MIDPESWRPAALVFDLDGTLVDSRRDLATAINRLRLELGLAPHSVPAIIGMVDEGALRVVERALGPGFPRDEFAAAVARYFEIYAEVLLDETVPYPGVPEMLATLAERFPLALLTNKGERFSRAILDGMGLTKHFRVIVGGDSLPTRKPDPQGLQHVAKFLGCSLEELVLIGDSRFDAETAHAAGCRFALVEWGFPSAAERAEMAADWRFAAAADLAAAFGPLVRSELSSRET